MGQAQLPDLGVLFVRLDRNGDGSLSVKEFVEGMQVLLPGLMAKGGPTPALQQPLEGAKPPKDMKAPKKPDGEKTAAKPKKDKPPKGAKTKPGKEGPPPVQPGTEGFPAEKPKPKPPKGLTEAVSR
jgi:hypothetical protein